MNEKTIEHAASVIKALKEKCADGVIKDHEIPSLCNMETGKTTGFAVILTLGTKFDYTNRILDEWKDLLKAEDYMISVRRNQLRVRFNVMFDKRKRK
jgi:hypothetical protein